MRVWAIDPGAEIGAWIAALAGAYALGSQVWKAIKNRKKELTQINNALNIAPEARQQLELGNVGEAIRHLNEIIKSQDNHIRNQTQRMTECDREIDTQRSRADQAEDEAQEWEDKYLDAQQKIREMERTHEDEILKLRTQNQKDRKTFARALAQARVETSLPEEKS
jgi:predicted RNase H-like nuclease (RuvC/YqgF family)